MSTHSVHRIWAPMALALDGAYVGAMSVVAFCALAPFNGTTLFHDGLGMVAGVLVLSSLSVGVLRALFEPGAEMRACALAAGSGLIYLSSLLDEWARSSAARATSALASGLSRTYFELPWVALLMAVALGALTVLQFVAARRLLRAWPDQATLIVSLSWALLCSGLLLRALIAYSSGSASLFVTAASPFVATASPFAT